MRTFDKLGAARSQLDTAIELFFQEKDEVSIHTLTSASFTILRDLGRRRGMPDPFEFTNNAPGVLKKKIISLLNEPQNFFKHADSDPSSLLHFNPTRTIYDMLMASSLYTQISQKASPLMTLFTIWFFTYRKDKLPEMLHIGLLSNEEKTEILNLIEGRDHNDRQSFLNLLPALERGGLTDLL